MIIRTKTESATPMSGTSITAISLNYGTTHEHSYDHGLDALGNHKAAALNLAATQPDPKATWQVIDYVSHKSGYIFCVKPIDIQ